MEIRGGSRHQYELRDLQIISLRWSIMVIERMEGLEAESMWWMLHADREIADRLEKGESYYDCTRS